MIQHHNTLDNIINSKQEILVTVDGEAKIENVDYEDVIDKVKYITPVPGGVGPMTVCMLINNLIKNI